MRRTTLDVRLSQPCPVCERPRIDHDPRCPPKVERRLTQQDKSDDAKAHLMAEIRRPFERILDWVAARLTR